MSQADSNKNRKPRKEDVLDMIRKLRNDRIKDFLDERFLLSYFEKRYHWMSLTDEKVAEIKSGLKEMLATPVDAKHYQPLINEIHQTDPVSINEVSENLFQKDIEKVLTRFLS